MARKKKEQTLEEFTNKLGKPPRKNYHNSPVISDGGYLTKDGDNSKFNALALELFNLPMINIKDINQVVDQINRYFQIYIKYDMKPTVSGMATALGIHRQTLHSVVNDLPVGSNGYKLAVPPEVADFIKRSYQLLEVGWENYMLQYKINPVAGIFLAKNNFKYTNKTELEVSPGEQQQPIDLEAIKQRYLTDSETND